MIAVRGRARSVGIAEPLEHDVWLLVDSKTVTPQRTGPRAYLVDGQEKPPDGFALYVSRRETSTTGPCEANHLALPSELAYLAGGDVILLSKRGEQIRVLWRAKSPLNSVLLTERCDHYCLMCSQPPKRGIDDWLLRAAFDLVRLLPRTTSGIAFTGGEPTLHGNDLVRLLKLCRNLLPFAGVHAPLKRSTVQQF